MPQSLAQIYVHIVFSTHERRPCIATEVQSRLHAYLAGACKAIDCPAVKIGGVEDHIHILLRLSKTRTLSDTVKDIKVESSKWMKADGRVPDFSWQAGCGAFSVGASQVEDVCDYISRQHEHHKKRTFQEEFRALLQRYGVKFDEAYVWD